MSLYFYSSNQATHLISNFNDNLKKPLFKPLEKEIVLIQSQAMQDWLSMQLAEKNTICINTLFLFPESFLQKILPEEALENPYEVPYLRWTLMKIIGNLPQKEEFSFFSNFLKKEKNDKILFNLSKELANLYGQYLTFRPDLILKWETSKKATHWQEALWKEIAKEINAKHKAHLRNKLLLMLKNKDTSLDLPGRLSVFGVSFLPSIFIKILKEISVYIDVFIYFINPFEKDAKSNAHPFINDLKEQGKALKETWLEGSQNNTQDYQLSNEISILNFFKQYLLENKKMDSKSLNQFLTNQDPSIQIHQCSSLLREVEILHHQLLYFFNHLPNLKPNEIVVIAPEIELYRNSIEAVFSNTEDESMLIPHTISQHESKEENKVIESFISFLNLIKARVTLNEIFDFLEIENVRLRFNFSEKEIENLKYHFQKAGARWGYGEEREENLPSFKENSWSFAIERLLVKYSFLSEKHHYFQGILPVETEVGNDEEEGIAKLAFFLDFIFETKKKWSEKATLSEWKKRFESISENYLVNSFLNQEHLYLTEKFQKLKDVEKIANFKEPVSFDVASKYALELLSRIKNSSVFFRGTVTFSSALPIRSLPFKIICFIGLNGGKKSDELAFPRKDNTFSFNLIKQNPRKGDRSKKKDDEYLFLESFIAASSIFYISYNRENNFNKNQSFPSNIVLNYLEAFKEMFPQEKQTFALEKICHKHPSYGFDKEYFIKNSPLKNFSKEDYLISKQLNETKPKKQNNPKKETSKKKKLLNENKKTLISLEEMLLFFSNPCKFFYKNTLNTTLYKPREEEKEEEPFEINFLTTYQIAEEMINRTEGIKSFKEEYRYFLSQGKLPIGIMGEKKFQKIYQEVKKYLKTLEIYKKKETVIIDCDFENYHLKGNTFYFDQTIFLYHQFAKFKKKYFLYAWLPVLFLQAQERKKIFVSRIVSKDKECFLNLKGGEENHLLKLIDLFLEGKNKPIPFFTEASYLYAHEKQGKKKNHYEVIKKVKSKFDNQNKFNKESKNLRQDPYINLAYKDQELFSSSFETIADLVYQPIIQSSSKIK